MLNNVARLLAPILASLFFLMPLATLAQPPDGLGQTIQIHTHFNSFLGRPLWLLMIRDVDHNMNIPYVYEVERGDNFWIAFTYSNNYLILASTMQFSPYKRHPLSSKTIEDFCHLESHGRIIRGESMFVTIKGDLRPNTERFQCAVSNYANPRFTIVSENMNAVK